MTSQEATFRVFVSSTFDDLTEERNALQEVVFPRLEDLSRQHGCRFQAIDLRWGIGPEVALEQRTVSICLDEIARCQSTTLHPNFIILLGDRYGWRPLPSEIADDEFRQLLAHVAPSDAEPLREWYALDRNALPPVHCLRPRAGDTQNLERWRIVEDRLRSILSQACLVAGLPEEARLKYFASATELEAWKGALQVPDAHEHVFCFFRHITGLPPADDLSACPGAARFVDVTVRRGMPEPDQEAARRLRELKDKLRLRLPAHVFEYRADWTGDGITSGHLPGLCDDAFRVLAKVILQQIEDARTQDSLSEETSAQSRFHGGRTSVFIGRTKELEAIGSYLSQDDPHPFAVLAEAGAGKSALLARAAEIARTVYPEALVIERFVGATPACSDTRGLLEGICLEISRYYGLGEASVPADVAMLKRVFALRLGAATAQHPILLFIDAVDQLADSGDKHDLAWVPRLLPDHVRLLLSATPTESGASCLASLVAPSHVLELQGMCQGDGRQLLRLWLSQAGRTLQEAQMDVALSSFKGGTAPGRFWLVFQEVRRWRSYDEASPLPPDTEGILRHVLRRLVAEHGRLLVSRSLGALAAAGWGLTEGELLDLLSSSDNSEVLEDIKARARHQIRLPHIPFAVWARLRADLGAHLTSRAMDRAILLGFAERHLELAVVREFLSGEELRKTHERLARYFGNQPLAFGPAFNLRKLRVLPRHQCLADQPHEAYATLTDLRFLEAKAMQLDVTQTLGRGPQHRGVYALQSDLRLAVEACARTGAEEPVRGVLEALRDCLTSQSGHIAARPSALGSQVAWEARRRKLPLRRLPWISQSGAGRPYSGLQLDPYVLADSSGGARRLAPRLSSATSCTVLETEGLAAAIGEEGRFVITDMETGDEVFTVDLEPALSCGFIPGVRPSLVVGGKSGVVHFVDPDGACVVSRVRVHNSEIMGLSVSRLGRFLAACGSRDRAVKIIDLVAGTNYVKEEGFFHSFNDCAFSPVEDLLAVASTSGIVYLHNVAAQSWQELYQHEAEADVCVFSASGTILASGGHRGDLVVWDLAGGREAWRKDCTRSSIPALAFLEDSALFTGDADGFIDEYEVSTGRHVRRLTQLPGSVFRLTLDRRRMRLIAAADGLWEVDLSAADDGPVTRLWSVFAVAPLKGDKVAVGGEKPALSIIAGGIHPASAVTVLEPEGFVTMAHAAPGGGQIAVGWATSTKGPSPAGKVELRDLESGEVRVLESGSHSGDINTYINDACFLRNGQMLLGSFCSLNPGAGRMDRLVCWDIGSAKSVAISCEAGQGPCSVTWIPERSLLVAGHADGTVRVYEDRRKGPQSSQEAFVEIRRFRLHEAAIWSCLFAPAFGGIVTAGSDGYLKVSDPDRGRELQVLHRQGSSINSCALAPDGLLLASASSSGAIRFWLAGREQASSVFFAGTYVNGVAFADDGDLLYFGGGRGLVGVIRVQLNR